MECFSISYLHIEGRLDPSYYLPETKKIELKNFPQIELGELFEINRGGSPRPISDYITDSEDGINWIKIGDTKGIDKYIYETKEKIKPEGAKRSRWVYEDDFILSNSMSFGRPYIMKTKGCIHDGWLLLRKRNSDFNSDYLYSVLSTDYIYSLFKRATIGGVVQNLNIGLVKKIKIPVPQADIQSKIVSIVNKSHAEKKALEDKAEKLLNSIDSYMLEQLGIDLPESASRICHSVPFSELVGKRCDPMPYQPKRLDMIKAISNGKYELKPLKDITLTKNNQKKENPSNFPYVGLENIESNTGVYLESKDEKTEFGSALHFYPNNILFPKLRPYLNKVYHSTMEGFCSTEFHVLEAKPEILTSYLAAFLRSQAVVRQTSCLMTGNTLPRLQTEDVQNIPIPVPPKTLQNEIAEEVGKRRVAALLLKEQSTVKIAQAKAEIERILFGDAI